MEKDPSGISADARGAKLDSGKAPIYRGVIQYFPKSLRSIALLSKKGAIKYSWHGWSAVQDAVPRYTDAMQRHLLDEQDKGFYDDSEGGTGLPHATCVAWNALARLEKLLEEQEELENA